MLLPQKRSSMEDLSYELKEKEKEEGFNGSERFCLYNLILTCRRICQLIL